VLADMVSYNERTGTLTANGNVRVVEEDGTTYYANYVELSADFRDGFVRDMSVLLADRSRIAAVYATRTAGERKDFWKGVYTACDTCPTSEGSVWPTLSGNEAGTRERMPPVWQIRAAHVTHDEVARDIIYRDATLEVFGIPVAYTPYLRQPDPTVYRRSGLLSPIFGVDDGMGYWTEVPYYLVIDDQQDATLAVRAMSEEAWLLRPEYRMRFAEGELSLAGSFTDDGDEGLSGHLNSRGRWHINDIWRAGFDSELASFDGYLDRYDFPRPTWLTNHAWVEAFSGRSYAAIEGFHYNDTRTDLDDAENPIVLPLVTYDYESEPGWMGGQALLDGGLQSIHREDGPSGTRVSGSVGWRLPGTTAWGLAYEAETRLNADVYSVSDANTVEGDPTSGYDGMVSRLYPSARLTLRYPMIRVAPSHRQIVEPVVALAMAPPGLNTKRIPNEDSLDPELHIANLLTGDRTAGRDLIDDGMSVNYGLRWSYIDDDGGSVQASFGQAYRFLGDDTPFPRQAGYGSGLSDYVGGLDVRPNPYLDVFARVRLDRDTLDPNTAVLGFRGGTAVLNVSGTYVNATSLDARDGNDLPRREEIVASVGTAFSRYWDAYAGGRYDFVNDRTVDIWGGVSYEDECLVLALDYTTSYNEVDGEDEGESVVLRVTLKTLGEISF
jgi:LPS-assembly protein